MQMKANILAMVGVLGIPIALVPACWLSLASFMFRAESWAELFFDSGGMIFERGRAKPPCFLSVGFHWVQNVVPRFVRFCRLFVLNN
jgi:hypothetical protein